MNKEELLKKIELKEHEKFLKRVEYDNLEKELSLLYKRLLELNEKE